MAKPIVAIVGRQNVGKSTLLNRLVGKRLSIVEDLPGTTRDRVFADTSWQGRDFTVIDTGGLEPNLLTTVSRGVQAQIGIAIEEADIIIFLTDVRDGVTAGDIDIADMLRRAGKPVLLAVNKADNPKLEAGTAEFYQLGLGEPFPISAIHGHSTADMLDKVVSLFPPEEPEKAETIGMKLAIVGRPNVGKSTLLNALLGEERSIVDEVPGTTRDAIDVVLDFEGQSVLLIDTAGIRRRGRVEAGIEWYSVLRSMKAIDRADVALLVLDATELVAAQDAHVAGYLQQATKGVLIIVNKWDLVPQKNQREYTDFVRSQLKFLAYAPVLYMSAKSGQGVAQVMPEAVKVYQERLKRVPAEALTGAMKSAVGSHVLPRKGRRELKLSSVTQTGTNPPSFEFLVNDAKLIHFSYERYLENKLRESFGFAGTPINIVFKTRGES